MVAIAAEMTDAQDWLPLSEADATAFEPGFYAIGSEKIEVTSPHYTSRRTDRYTRHPFDGRFAVRGVDGSTAGAHKAGAALTRYYPDVP
jgi:hypothetical protein